MNKKDQRKSERYEERVDVCVLVFICVCAPISQEIPISQKRSRITRDPVSQEITYHKKSRYDIIASNAYQYWGMCWLWEAVVKSMPLMLRGSYESGRLLVLRGGGQRGNE